MSFSGEGAFWRTFSCRCIVIVWLSLNFHCTQEVTITLSSKLLPAASERWFSVQQFINRIQKNYRRSGGNVLCYSIFFRILDIRNGPSAGNCYDYYYIILLRCASQWKRSWTRFHEMTQLQRRATRRGA